MIKKQLILIPGLFALGMLAGIAIFSEHDPEQPTDAGRETEPAALANDYSAMPNPFITASPQVDSTRIERLEGRLEQLGRRVEELEQNLAETAAAEPENDAVLPELATASGGIRPNTGMQRALTTENLVKAGIAPELANDIVRRKNEIELKKLELRDRASRENYLGTGRYNRELNELNASDVSLRDELGDDYYDNYLYATGQNNRVLVTSVMLGSQAEIAGMQDGDIILSYGGQNLFDWSELQQATTQGARGEFVSMNVLRDSQLINLWIPRGPLGVRLGAARREP